MTDFLTQALNTVFAPFKNNASVIGFATVKVGGEPQTIKVTSNIVTTDFIKVALDKTPDKTLAEVGDEIKYTVTFVNNSSVDLYDVKIVDTISPMTTLVADSIIPVPQPGEALETGVTITSANETKAGSVPKGQSATLEYQVTVNQGAAGDIINNGTATIKFKDCKDHEYSGSTNPSQAITTVITADLQVVQSADKTFVTENNEEVVYTLVIKNTGSIKITDITVTNPIPQGMTYKQNSTLKNDTLPLTDENPANGINIGDLNPSDTYKIQFSVTVSL